MCFVENVFVTTNACLSQQNFCHDKNDTCGSTHQWYGSPVTIQQRLAFRVLNVLYLSSCLSACLSLSACLPACLSACLSICLTDWLTDCPSHCLCLAELYISVLLICASLSCWFVQQWKKLWTDILSQQYIFTTWRDLVFTCNRTLFFSFFHAVLIKIICACGLCHYMKTLTLRSCVWTDMKCCCCFLERKIQEELLFTYSSAGLACRTNRYPVIV